MQLNWSILNVTWQNVESYSNRKIETAWRWKSIPSEITPVWQNDLVSILVCLHSLPHLTVTSLLLVFSQGISSREDRDDLVRSSSHTPSNKAQILAMPQFGLRDNLIRCELLKNEDLYTYLEDFRYVFLLRLLCPFWICFENIYMWQDVELGT